MMSASKDRGNNKVERARVVGINNNKHVKRMQAREKTVQQRDNATVQLLKIFNNGCHSKSYRSQRKHIHHPTLGAFGSFVFLVFLTPPLAFAGVSLAIFKISE